MQANPRYHHQAKTFWANVRTIGQELGYTLGGQVRVYSLEQITEAMSKAGLGSAHLLTDDEHPTLLASDLLDYFVYRAEILNQVVEPSLMDSARAKTLYESLFAEISPTSPSPTNKQKGEKRQIAYMTAIVNMLIQHYSGNAPCDYNPRVLTTVTREGAPLRTLARRVDGCFPSCVNPIALWEIKEYYYTTTFGSRIADGVYESLLDGLELEELLNHENVEIEHLLVVDSHAAWWQQGKSYLCRLIDMLNMGYVDELLFGYEVVDRLPKIVAHWVEKLNARG